MWIAMTTHSHSPTPPPRRVHRRRTLPPPASPHSATSATNSPRQRPLPSPRRQPLPSPYRRLSTFGGVELGAGRSGDGNDILSPLPYRGHELHHELRIWPSAGRRGWRSILAAQIGSTSSPTAVQSERLQPPGLRRRGWRCTSAAQIESMSSPAAAQIESTSSRRRRKSSRRAPRRWCGVGGCSHRRAHPAVMEASAIELMCSGYVARKWHGERLFHLYMCPFHLFQTRNSPLC